MLLGVEERPRGLDCRSENRGEFHRALTQLERSARDVRDVEQVVEQAAHVSYLAFDDLLKSLSLLRRRSAAFRRRERVSDRRQRVSQLMRQQCDELIFALVRKPQAFLGLAQRFISAPAVADVTRDLGCTDNRALGVMNRGHRKRYGNQPAVFGDADRVEMLDALPGA